MMEQGYTKEEVFLSKFYGVTNVVIGKTKTYESSSNTKRFPNSPGSWKPIGQPRYFPHQAPRNEVQLSEEDLSRALAFIFTSTTAEVIEFNDKTWVKKKCILKENILIRRGRIMERQTVKIAGGAEKFVDIGELVGINFAVPVIDRYSPWALSFAEHIHNNVKVSQHRAAQSCYRASLRKVYIIRGESLFQKVCENCFVCRRLRKKFFERVMGSPLDAQLTISPLFYSTMVDLVGPFDTFVPSFERTTRNSKSKSYKIHIGIFLCVATGCLNLQVVESQKATGLTAASHFSMESGVPQVMFPDKQSRLENILREVQVTLKDLC